MTLNKKELGAFIFDIDGCLLDSMNIWTNLSSTYLKNLGIVPNNNIDKEVSLLDLEESVHLINTCYNLDIKFNKSEAEIKKEIIKLLEDFYKYQVELKPGAKDLVETLYKNNIPMVLATSGDETLARLALERLGILEFFAGLRTCSELNTTKAQDKIFLQALEIANLQSKKEIKKENCYVIEDSIKALKTVKKSGFKSIGIYDKNSQIYWKEIQETADFAIKNLSEINIKG